MPSNFYAPLDVESDIEWDDLLEKLVVRNLAIADAYSGFALEYAQSNPVFARNCIEIAKRRLAHVDQLLSHEPC